MTSLKAKWILAVAIARYKEGSRILRVYEPVLNEKQRLEIQGTRENFRLAAVKAAERLYRETMA